MSGNQVAYIPPQCYTNVIDGVGEAHNPCYACHTISKVPNFMNDTDVQENYGFPETALKNYWTNVYKDRTTDIGKISDESILNYVRQDNYFTSDSRIILAEKMKSIPPEWDRNKNGQWDGYTPDVYFNFNADGFDVRPDGQLSGWRVYAYFPFLGTFLPTNGSTDDVMIRLPDTFRKNEQGVYDPSVYKVNLAIVEAMIKQQNVAIEPTDEKLLQVDLNKNDRLDIATEVVYDWAPLKKRFMSYVGEARQALEDGSIHIAGRLFPEGTEFVHSVRYIDVDGDKTRMAKRMKELRYSRKLAWKDYYDLRLIGQAEFKERHDFPERTKTIIGNMEAGMNAQHGWVYQGFIEDDAGQLRPQTYEETMFCMGCHGNIGAHADTNLSFQWKLGDEQFRHGWYSWMEKGLDGVADPLREDGAGQYAFYLRQNPTGNEYRTNTEVFSKFFNKDGTEKPEAFARLAGDISYLLMPSTERALLLNKAYKVIVDEQSFSRGREGVVEPMNNIHREVEADQETGITQYLSRF
ncbi:hypothetical protein ACQUQU_12880 [Thalassolituus sp. LLYu03]|uniref:hypothetical protein n=1 Tax=Thalassolituus sp. LLYu03 TaxID=3421656 RepID=UPI003D2C1CCA